MSSIEALSRAAIADAGLQPSDIQSGIVGNFAAGLYTRQLHLGSLLIDIDEGEIEAARLEQLPRRGIGEDPDVVRADPGEVSHGG